MPWLGKKMRANRGVKTRRVESGEWGSWGWGSIEAPPAGSRVDPEPKSNLVHFGLKIRHPVSTILLIFVRIS